MPGRNPRGAARSASPPAAASVRRRRQRGGQSTTLLTVVLALALLAVGVAGYQAAMLLTTAVYGPTGVSASSSNLANYVCFALLRQDYQRLGAYIDPAPIPPAVTGTFDARTTLARLRTLDTDQGVVTACSVAPYGAGRVVSSDGSVSYRLTLRRAKAAGPASGALVLRERTTAPPDWQIERDSSFLIAPAV